MFRKFAVRGELSPEYGEEWQLPIRRIDLQHIVTRDRRRIGFAVVIKRPDARITPNDILAPERRCQVAIDRGNEVLGLGLRNPRRLVQRIDRDVGRADQRELILVGDHEDHALVRVLQEIGVRFAVDAWNDDMAALDQPYCCVQLHIERLAQDPLDPGPRRVDHAAGLDQRLRSGVGIRQQQAPHASFAIAAQDLGPHANIRTVFACGHRVDQGEPRVVHPRIGVKEPPGEDGLQAGAIARVRERHRTRTG